MIDTFIWCFIKIYHVIWFEAPIKQNKRNYSYNSQDEKKREKGIVNDWCVVFGNIKCHSKENDFWNNRHKNDQFLKKR